MKTFFTAFGGAIVGALVALLLIVVIGAFMIGGLVGQVGQPQKLPKEFVLSLDLRAPMPDQAPTAGLSALFGEQGFVDILLKLDAARTDDRVQGLFIRGSEIGIGSSRSEELRDALAAFKASGKFVVAHSQGSFGGGPSGYRAIAAADEIWAQPGSDLIASGISFETLFLKGLFDNLSVSPEIVALYEYKNAPNSYQEADYTVPHREAMTRLAQSIWTVSLTDIAEDRGLTLDDAKAALESGPLNAERMVELKLADKIGWPETAEDAIRARTREDVAFLAVTEYVAPFPDYDAPKIAIVGGEGAITTGVADEGPFAQANGILSDTTAAAILEAARNDEVQAIVFRVDSPGGSPTASDQIWNAVEIAQAQYDKPVVVSMGSVAASGGYYVSTGADWIVANRSTITGSIGIFGGKFATSEGLARIGVNARSIDVGGPFTGAFTSATPFTDAQAELLEAWLKRGYDRFVSLVAEGRNLTVEQVDERARGRVWSGEDALGNGLVDEVGGLMDAIAKARELAGIAEGADVQFLSYPSKSGFPFGQGFVETSGDLAALARVSELLGDARMQALIGQAEALQSGSLQATTPVMIER